MKESLIISYCIFTPKKGNEEFRYWDAHNSNERYWYNIPALMAVNTLIYPHAKIKIHLSKDIREHPRFDLLKAISEAFENIELVFLPYEYSNTEPTLWRVKPVFDKEADVILCRDIDSLPNEDEIRATYYFLQHDSYLIHTLRTHENHIRKDTVILAGLSGFRPREINILNEITFDKYYEKNKSTSWGLDQTSLVNFFTQDEDWTSNYFLDSPITTKYHNVGANLIKCVSLDQLHYKSNVDITDINPHIIDILNKETKWAGEPINLRGKKLKDFFELEELPIKKMKRIIESSSNTILEFYLEEIFNEY